MNPIALLHPQLPPADILGDFLDALEEHSLAIERLITLLRKNPGEKDLISDLFRQVHSIKGDAALSRLEGIVYLLHPLESLMVRLRQGEFIFSPLLAELFLLTLDRLELMGEAYARRRGLENLNLLPLIEGLEQLKDSPPEHLDSKSADLIETLTGFRPSPHPVTPSDNFVSPSSATTSTRQELDLEVFRSWARQFEAQSPLFEGRIQRLRHLCLGMNDLVTAKIDPAQLEAAICMHDIGMMLLPDRFWLKPGQLNDKERQMLHAHPALAADLLERIPGWEIAARIVREHHEMQNGGGYPKGLKSDQISEGARLLAIADAFESVMMKHTDRGRNRSVLRAVAEINACEYQFDPRWIKHLNTVIHRLLGN